MEPSSTYLCYVFLHFAKKRSYANSLSMQSYIVVPNSIKGQLGKIENLDKWEAVSRRQYFIAICNPKKNRKYSYLQGIIRSSTHHSYWVKHFAWQEHDCKLFGAITFASSSPSSIYIFSGNLQNTEDFLRAMMTRKDINWRQAYSLSQLLSYVF